MIWDNQGRRQDFGSGGNVNQIFCQYNFDNFFGIFYIYINFRKF